MRRIMFKQVSRTLLPSAVIILCLAVNGLYGQQQSVNIQELEESAFSNFNQAKYHLALDGFMTLLEIEENEAMYSYYAGRCLVELNEGLDEAIELLYGASKAQDQTDAVFFLGMAYFRYYNFRDAQRCFEQFEMTASRQEKKLYNVKHLIASCRSAREITSSYNPFDVLNVTFMDMSDSLQYSQVKMKGGQLSPKPRVWVRGDEDPTGLSGLMFIPADPVRGDYAYFAGYGKGEKDGTQIYRVRKGTGRGWSDPEEVSSLNSSGNELLPYFDPIENDLYFASDGRHGVGAYDLYRSHYDMERDLWTEPMNLGFPVNSVMDEFLLLPGSDLGMVLFFSTRQGTDSTLTVYRVHLVEPKKKTSTDSKMLREIAQMGGVAEEILAGMEEIEQVDQSTHRIVIPEETEADDQAISLYHESLSSALRHQVVSDSLKDLASNARIRVRESDDPNDRWVWQKQIMVWEKRARDEEALADGLYARMEHEHPVNTFEPAVNPPETIVEDKKIGDLTVYRYAEAEHGVLGEPGTQPELKKDFTPASEINRFDFLTHSPYTSTNPIPMDLALPSGTFYRVQLGAFGVAVEPEAFGGMSPITGEHLKERGLIKYYAGKFSKYQDASHALSRIRSKGYEDAFIVAWYNGNPVSTQKAKQLE
jgi:tetratricopeptide (TPR) repeat protein